MGISTIGYTSTTSRIEVAYDNSTPSSASHNDTDLDMDLLINMLWSYYNKYNGDTDYFLIALYVLVIALAVTTNMLVIAVVFKYRDMRSVTNYFVVNLSIADLLVTLICMPVAVSQAVSIVWRYGELMCKLSSYLQGVAVAASVFTITAMSMDRCLAIRSPMAFRHIFNRRSTIFVIVGVWLVALCIFLPVLKGVTLYNPAPKLDNITTRWALERNFSLELLRSRMPPTVYICAEDFTPLGIRTSHFGTMCFVVVYAVPGFVVILAYSMMGRTLCSRKPPFDSDSTKGSASSQQSNKLLRERRRIAWILLLLAALFALCWLPYNVLRLLLDLGATKGKSVSDALAYCLFLGHANSAINPVVYCIMTRNFRRSVSQLLRRNPQGLSRRKFRRKKAMNDKICGGCSMPYVGRRRGLLRQRSTTPGCDCIPITGQHAVLALRRNTTSSSYDSCRNTLRRFMLKTIPENPQVPANPPINIRREYEQPDCEKNNGFKSSQPGPSTLCTTDERRA